MAVNQLEFRELLRHPYLSYKQVQAIALPSPQKRSCRLYPRVGMFDEFTSDDIYRSNPIWNFRGSVNSLLSLCGFSPHAVFYNLFSRIGDLMKILSIYPNKNDSLNLNVTRFVD